MQVKCKQHVCLKNAWLRQKVVLSRTEGSCCHMLYSTVHVTQPGSSTEGPKNNARYKAWSAKNHREGRAMEGQRASARRRAASGSGKLKGKREADLYTRCLEPFPFDSTAAASTPYKRSCFAKPSVMTSQMKRGSPLCSCHGTYTGAPAVTFTDHSHYLQSLIKDAVTSSHSL